MIILFPSYPTNVRQPDPSFEDEYNAAKALGMPVGLCDVEFMFGAEVTLRLPEASPGSVVLYRGWILKQASYEALAEAVTARGHKLINSPAQYELAQSIPLWYGLLKDQTPESVWMPGDKFSEADIDSLTNTFGSQPIMVKDYMKSRKQDWFEACYIPDASDKENVYKITNKFLDLQGDCLTGGLVFRKFEDLEKIGTHPKTHMPLVSEWRIFIVNGNIIDTIPYWDQGKYNSEPPNYKVPELDIPFYSMDIARKVSGEIIIIEIGDGGSSGIPSYRTPGEYYTKLKESLV